MESGGHGGRGRGGKHMSFDVEGVKMADDFPTTVAFLFLASGGT
jgi:hypothetical protein